MRFQLYLCYVFICVFWDALCFGPALDRFLAPPLNFSLEKKARRRPGITYHYFVRYNVPWSRQGQGSGATSTSRKKGLGLEQKGRLAGASN